MAKPTKLRRPSWFNPQFAQPSEWGTLRLSERDAPAWLTEAADVMTKTPLSRELVAVQEPLVQNIRGRGG